MAETADLVTAQALAKALNLSVETIWRYTRENKIPYIEVGTRQYRYNLADVLSALKNPTARERAADYAVDQTKGMTYEDYLQLPDEPGYRHELLEGVLFRELSPNVAHQRATLRLIRILEDYFREREPEGEVFVAPLDVTFHDITVVQPDILYVSGEHQQIVKATRIDGAPALVVEVISPSSGRKDRLQKLRIYQEQQVQHYWLASPEDRTLECFSLHDGVYALVAAGMDDDVVEHPELGGLSVPLERLWKGNAELARE